MQGGLLTALLWLLFGGTHMGLSARPIRKALVNRLGETGFIVAYSMVALVTFGMLAHHVALHRFDEPHTGLLVTVPPVRGALVALSILGFSMFIAAVLVYPRLPMATFRHRVTAVRGIQQVTRHPFFSGIAIWAAAHTLLAPSSVSFVFFVGLVLLAVLGGMHQDRRMMAELGEPYRSYVAATSFWPFVAAVTKRQRIRWAEQPWIAYAIGVAISVGLYRVHDHIWDHGGGYVIATVSIGSMMAIVGSRVRSS